jgi:hypothetical protein
MGVYNVSPFIWDIGVILHADIEEHHIKKHSKDHKKAKQPQVAEVEFRLSWRHETVSPDERPALAQFDDVLEWALLYENRYFPYWHTTRDHWLILDDPQKRSELMRTWFTLALRNPGLVLRHRVQTARIGWLIDADQYRASIYAHRVLPERLGRVIDPPFDWLTRAVRLVLAGTVDDERLQPFIAYPALACYIAFLFFALDALRRRSARYLAVAAPLATNWAATMAFCMAQDARYFYSAFVVLPFALGLPWTTAQGEPASRAEPE